MGHFATAGGRFITIVPHKRREDTWFRDYAQSHAPDWREACRREGLERATPTRCGGPSSHPCPPRRATA
jgi:hypothetical protein